MAVIEMDYYEGLRNAIILQAVKDFRQAYRRYLKNPAKKELSDEVARQSKFFVSDWYATLTDIDGEGLLARVMEEEKRKMKKEASHGNTDTDI